MTETSRKESDVINLSAFYLTIPLIAGIAAGFLLRGKKRIDTGKINIVIILVLIFSLGFSIGVNRELLNSLPQVGVSALTMALLAVAFSVFFTVIVGRKLKL